ncbi:MAG TPA: 4Fe-4S binding protein [Caldithrix abyssi]|uniref:4Fe-4S binding protein n=1 Tax=Caldithrix abyssi TaxID=187145 RepID=A0A7V4TYU3_CALAY|nr:4Fe-4S binding protein [Caldithrix abyssi]
MAAKKKNYYRIILQTSVFLLLAYMITRLFVDGTYFADFEAYCPFGGMLALTSFLENNSLACSMTENQIFMGIALALGVVAVGKLFCSFICPIGTFTEWLGKIGDRFKVRYTLKGLTDRSLRILKYGLLFITIYYTVGSSELFCKEYDPYYAAFTGFGHDVVFWMAIITLSITMLGSIFIRQFWCKYLCPLGAVTNIFAFIPMFAGVLIIYLILLKTGLEISWVWPLAAVSVFGFLLETTRLRTWLFPPFKITRSVHSCTDCKLCDKQCPMGIQISSYEVVDHIDCHLCGDCLYACPVNETIQINKKERRWLPATATLSLVVLGLLLALNIELPTINLRWGNDMQMQTAGIFSKSGLKNVKCYGSAISFASKMKRVPGVLGVEAYVKSHTVKIFYDPDRIDERGLKRAIFTPSRTLLKSPPPRAQISAIRLKIDHLFDTYDTYYLTQLLKQSNGIWGFQTQYGEPVEAIIYYDPAKLSTDRIKAIIQSPEVTYKTRNGSVTQELDFSVAEMDDTMHPVERDDFIRKMFSPFNLPFNDYKKYTAEQLEVYQVPFKQAMNPRYRREFQFLAAHLSLDSSIVRFETTYTDQPYARIYYVKSRITEDQIWQMLKQDTLHFMYRGGKMGSKKNVFHFNEKGMVLSRK